MGFQYVPIRGWETSKEEEAFRIFHFQSKGEKMVLLSLHFVTGDDIARMVGDIATQRDKKIFTDETFG